MSPDTSTEHRPDPVVLAKENFSALLQSASYNGFLLEACLGELQSVLTRSNLGIVEIFEQLASNTQAAADFANRNQDQLRALVFTEQAADFHRFHQKAQELVSGQTVPIPPLVEQLDLSQGKGQKTNRSTTPSK